MEKPYFQPKSSKSLGFAVQKLGILLASKSGYEDFVFMVK
jgi:hypothetical protein